MKKLLILPILFLVFSAQAQQVPDSVYLERLQEMSDADQSARRMLDSELNKDSVWRVIHAVDSANLIELKQLINERGFPTLSKVGYQCCNLASLIAQHQPPEFLHWFLGHAQAAADTGDFDLTWIAYMTDRDYVIPDDVKYLAPYVLSHRLSLTHEAKIEKRGASDVIRSILESVAVPKGQMT